MLMKDLDPIALLAEHGLTAEKATRLPSEMDQIWKVLLSDGSKVLLRISAAEVREDRIAFENAMLAHLAKKDLQTSLPMSMSEPFVLTSRDGKTQIGRVFSWVEGTILVQWTPHSHELLHQMGQELGALNKALEDFSHPAAHLDHNWKIDHWSWVRGHTSLFTGLQKDLVEAAMNEVIERVVPVLPELRESICHHDANDYNILVAGGNAGITLGLIDFGDACMTKTCLEVAIACAYLMMDKADPVSAACSILTGFNEKQPLTEVEVAALPGLIKLRLLISLTHSTLRQESDPENQYNQVSNAGAWKVLSDLSTLDYNWLHYCFRDACGLEPVPDHSEFLQQLSKIDVSPLFREMPNLADLPVIDLSIASTDLGTQAEIDDGVSLDLQIRKMLKDGLWGIGRYNEPRSVYTADNFLEEQNEGSAWRTIHLGVDVFAPAGTCLYSPSGAIVYSIVNNRGDRNYGPTLILKIGGKVECYLLFGHLSFDTLEMMSPGDAIAAGQQIGAIGAPEENGGWTPHVHLQLIRDPLQLQGDFPGACTPERRNIWKSLSPNPAALLGLIDSAIAYTGSEAADVLEGRRQHLPQNLSLSYQRPLHVLRGSGAYLLDADGQKYLDMVNNVAHVGHEHPRVVNAGRRQMAVLNTNTRYLHPNLVDCARYLSGKTPAGLDVVYFCNSGSEANELAMRIARTVSGRKNMLALENGYHGHTGACIDVGSYKFAGKGGTGKPPHLEILPMPDPYRGAYAAGASKDDYARDIRAALDRSSAAPAAFIHESILSCGGQIVPPAGYFSEIYRTLKEEGILTIADEVQTGVGRVGKKFWAFELFDVVPDIVTIGKPIGNGHPLAAVVTTRELADAFANGMEYFNTFAGNPVSAAIGLEVLKVVDDEDLQAHAAEIGDYLLHELENLKENNSGIGDVRGSGLFLGIEFVSNGAKNPSPEMAEYVVEWMKRQGILLSTDGPDHNVIKIKPPMVFSRSDADYFLEKFEETLGHTAVLRGHF